MGSSGSKPDDAPEISRDHPDPRPAVSVNPRLLQQLAGVDVSDPRASTSASGAGLGADDEFVHQQPQRDRGEEEAESLAGDLSRSRRVGGLLLRHEDEELAQVRHPPLKLAAGQYAT